MTRKLIDSNVKDGRIILETLLDDGTNETFVVMYSKGRLCIVSDTNNMHDTTIHLSGSNALDMSIAEIFPVLNIVSGRIPRYIIEGFRKDNLELLTADGFETISEEKKMQEHDPVDILTAGIGIGAAIAATIAVIITKGKK